MRNKNPVERCFDTLTSEVHRCDVLDASAEDAEDWLVEAVQIIGANLSREQRGRLIGRGRNYLAPVIERLT